MVRSLATATWFLLALAACDVGSVPGIGPDGGGGLDANAQLACRPTVTALPSGGPVGELNHNVGANCTQGGCHDGLSGPPQWTVAGTLYTARDGIAPNPGSTVTVIDSTGIVVDIPVAANGNFHTLTPVVPPLRTFASECPQNIPMVAPVATLGSCNTLGCHAQGDVQGRIYLP
jgi:hypothetical protein